MNDSTEATHYQIELTSRQVLAALVVLLVCLFAAFFSGVWIGRNAEADSAAHQLARVDEMSRGGERFDFFSKTGRRTPRRRVAAADEPSSPLGPAPIDQGDFGPDPDDAELDARRGRSGQHDRCRSGRAVRGRRCRGSDRRRAGAAGRDGPRRPSPQGGAAPEGANVAAAEEEPAAATESPAASGGPGTAADATGGGGEPADATPAADAASRPLPPPSGPPRRPGMAGFHIQVLATSDRDKAEALVARLVDADFKAFIVPSNEGGRTVYRVRVGPFDDRAIAAGKAEELESRWGLDSWISPGAP